MTTSEADPSVGTHTRARARANMPAYRLGQQQEAYECQRTSWSRSRAAIRRIPPAVTTANECMILWLEPPVEAKGSQHHQQQHQPAGSRIKWK